MNYKKLLKKRINKIEPNQSILDDIKFECGIVCQSNTKKVIYQKRWFKVFVPVMACFVLGITCTSVIFSMSRNSDLTSYVLMEMGAQVQFVTDDNIVVKQQGLNKEAQVLLLGCDYVDESIDDAIMDVANNAQQLGMINVGDEIKISAICEEVNNSFKKSNLYSCLNNINNNFEDYTFTNYFINRNNFINDVANKYACAVASVENKATDELLKIYVNYDQNENLKYHYYIYNEYNNVWDRTQNELNEDVLYNQYLNLSSELEIILTNLEIFNSNNNNELLERISQEVDKINNEYNNVLENFENSDSYYDYVNNVIINNDDEIDKILNQYNSLYKQNIFDLKTSLYQDIIKVA